MYLAVLRDVVVIPDGLVAACQVTGFQVFDGELLGDSRRRAVNHNQIYSAHGGQNQCGTQDCTASVPATVVITVAKNFSILAILVQFTLIIMVIF